MARGHFVPLHAVAYPRRSKHSLISSDLLLPSLTITFYLPLFSSDLGRVGSGLVCSVLCPR